MSRVMRGFSWLMSTSWPTYAAIVLGTNIVGAIAIMTFVIFFLPMPEIHAFTTDFDNLFVIGAAYVIFAVLVGMAATMLLFRPVWDWQRNPDAHDPNMVRNLVMRIPIYQAAVAALVWLIGIVLAVVTTSASDGKLALVVGVSTT
ncbi:MAG: adenylate/guanylate cyclase domain-containing protein, partial [Corynebacterium casei]